MKIEDIEKARERLKPYLAMTPLLHSSLLERELKTQVWLKLETQNPTGSFKPRPAFNSMLTHLNEAKNQGVIASSSGNFAQAVAFAGKILGVSTLIVMTERTSPYKIERTKALGAEVVLCGNTHEERTQTTVSLQQKTGRFLVHPYDTEETIAGDGTIGLELSEQLDKSLDSPMTVLVPVGGGGLIAGIAFALKTKHPKCKIIGVQSTKNASLAKSLQAGKPVNVGLVQTIADALVASELGKTAFTIIKEYVDEAILVEEKDIQSATKFMIEQHKLVVEPGGAVGIAALLTGAVSADHCICVLSGGNMPLWQNKDL